MNFHQIRTGSGRSMKLCLLKGNGIRLVFETLNNEAVVFLERGHRGPGQGIHGYFLVAFLPKKLFAGINRAAISKVVSFKAGDQRLRHLQIQMGSTSLNLLIVAEGRITDRAPDGIQRLPAKWRCRLSDES